MKKPKLPPRAPEQAAPAIDPPEGSAEIAPEASPHGLPNRARAPADFLVITALEEERNALHRHLGGVVQLEKDAGDVHTYFFAEVATGRHVLAYRVVTTCLLRMGPLHAAALTAAAVVRWRPQAVIMLGIAGGVRGEAELGDILLSEKVVDYTVGKVETEADGTPRRTVRWEAYPADATLLDDARNLRVPWMPSISVSRPKEGDPAVHCGTIASGGDVVAHAGTMAQLRSTWPKLVGVEMEGGGVATALHAAFERPRFLMVRGVSDLADPNKNKRSTAAWRPYACDAAGAYLMAALRSASFTPRGGDRGKADAPNASTRQRAEPASGSAAHLRARDLATLRSLWSVLPTDQIDLLIERAQYGIIPDSLLFFYESFRELYKSSEFYLYDENLRAAVGDFAEAFMECFSFGDFLSPLPSGREYKFIPDHKHASWSEWKAERARFTQVVARLPNTFKHLVHVTRAKWQEIDLAETSKCAREARARFEASGREKFGEVPRAPVALGNSPSPPESPTTPSRGEPQKVGPGQASSPAPGATTPTEAGPTVAEEEPVHEKFAGTLASNRADISEHRVKFRFKGRLLAKSRHETLRAVTFHELYRRLDGTYLVYEEVNHHGDYVTAAMHGVERPLELEDLFEEPFAAVASKAGLVRQVDLE